MALNAIDRLVDDVAAWSRGRDYPAPEEWLSGEGLSYCLWQLLDARRGWLGHTYPFRWKSGDVHRLLVDTVAPRLVDRHGMAEHGATAITILLDYLADADRFHPGSARTETLRRELGRAGPKYAAAMADRSVWRLGKLVFTAMVEDGVDIADDVAVWDWTAEFNKADHDRRRAVLKPLLDRQPELLTAAIIVADGEVVALAPSEPLPPRPSSGSSYAADTPSNRPVSLPSEAELAEAAAGSLLLAMLVSLGRWAGDGRSVSKRAALSSDDLRSLAEWVPCESDDVRDLRTDPGLCRWWEIAVELDILRMNRTRVFQGPRYALARRVRMGEAEDAAALEFWLELFERSLEPQGGSPDDTADAPARQWSAPAMRELYRANGAMTFPALTERLSNGVSGAIDPRIPELVERVSAREIGIAMLDATENGAATIMRGNNGMDVTSSDTFVELTALGRYAVRQRLLDEGTAATSTEST